MGCGRKALALSVHPSGLGFIGRQIKLGRSPQRRQRQRRDGCDRGAPPQFLLRHDLLLKPAPCVIIQPVGQLCKFRFSLRTENLPIPILDAQREIARFQLLPCGDILPRSCGDSAGLHRNSHLLRPASPRYPVSYGSVHSTIALAGRPQSRAATPRKTRSS